MFSFIFIRFGFEFGFGLFRVRLGFFLFDYYRVSLFTFSVIASGRYNSVFVFFFTEFLSFYAVSNRMTSERERRTGITTTTTTATTKITKCIGGNRGEADKTRAPRKIFKKRCSGK